MLFMSNIVSYLVTRAFTFDTNQIRYTKVLMKYQGVGVGSHWDEGLDLDEL